MKSPVIGSLRKLELLRADAGGDVSLLALCASVPDVDPLGGLLPSFGLRPGESSVTGGYFSESPLTPFEFTCLLLPKLL